MNNPQSTDLDLIKEFRLRRWARENFVPAQKRSRTWHPVVLEEMRRRDVELELDARSRDFITPYVPLPPVSDRRLHARHATHTQPKIFTGEESETFLPDLAR